MLAYRPGQRRDRQAADIRGDRRRQRRARHHADDPDLDARRLDQDRRLHVGPLHRTAARRVDEICREERERRLRRPGLQRPSWIVGGRARGCRRPDRAEVELMVPDCGSGVAEHVVRGDHRRPFCHIRLERPLEHVARVDQQDGAAVPRAGLAQVLQIAAQQRQAAAAVPRQDPAMEVVRADNRQRRDRRRRRRAVRRHAASATRSTCSRCGAHACTLSNRQPAVSVFLTFMCIWKITRL